MTPQEYCNIIVNYVNSKYGIFISKFTEEDVYNHCIKYSGKLDESGRNKIRGLVRETLSSLTTFSYLSLSNGFYEPKKAITNESNFTIYDTPRKMRKYTPEQIQRLNDIDTSPCDEPILNFGTDEDELGK